MVSASPDGGFQMQRLHHLMSTVSLWEKSRFTLMFVGIDLMFIRASKDNKHKDGTTSYIDVSARSGTCISVWGIWNSS